MMMWQAAPTARGSASLWWGSASTGPAFARRRRGARARTFVCRAFFQKKAQEFKKMVIGRAKERAFLIDDRHLEPTAVNVVMGPPDCGKSTLFKDMYGYGDYPSIYIDIGTPEALARQLAEKSSQLCYKLGNSRLGSTLAAMSKSPRSRLRLTFFWAYEPVLTVIFGKPQTGSSIREVGKLLKEALREARKKKGPGAPKPVLVFDDGTLSMLKHWPTSSAEWVELSGLLLEVTGEGLAHVYFLISDHTIRELLQQELGSKRVDTLVLGNLSRDDAEAYFTHRAEQCRIPLPPEQEERSRLFDRIHQVCGGNPGLMNSVADAYGMWGDWDTALDGEVYASKPRIDAALGVDFWGSHPGFTPGQFAKIAQLLLKEDGVVGKEAAVALVGPAAVSAMLREGLLSVRKCSPLAQDITPDRHPVWGVAASAKERWPGVILRDDVVVPASAPHLEYLRYKEGLINRLIESEVKGCL